MRDAFNQWKSTYAKYLAFLELVTPSPVWRLVSAVIEAAFMQGAIQAYKQVLRDNPGIGPLIEHRCAELVEDVKRIDYGPRG